MRLPENFSPEERGKRAGELFRQGYNCCQAVLLAFEDVLPLDRQALLSLGSGFGGGMGRMREVCGAVSAMTAISGFVSPAVTPADHSSRTQNYALVQELAGKFREEKGSIVCRELLDIKVKAKEGPEPSQRTPQYYHSRPCAALVGCSARIIAEKIGR